MSTSKLSEWQYLEPRPRSNYRQLFIKGTRIRARSLYGCHVREKAPMTPEEIAADYNLPLEAVLEAIAYCESKPAEIAQDYAREEAWMEAAGMNDPNYKYNPKPKVLTAQEIARLKRL